MSTTTAQPSATGFPKVFEEELRRHLAVRRGVADPSQLTPAAAFDQRLVGLALSGGGIRSATFNLGLLQALAKKGTLQNCDYLSTVSGGGYIGACLTSLCSEPKAATGVTPETFPLSDSDSVGRGNLANSVERPEVQHLRQHGKYLAVRGGPFRNDLWRMVATFLAGLVVTWLTIIAILIELASMNRGVVEGLVTATLDQKSPEELWAKLIQNRVADADFSHRSEEALLSSFEKWARGVRKWARGIGDVDKLNLAIEVTDWLTKAEIAAADGKLRARVGVWTQRARDYAAKPQELELGWMLAERRHSYMTNFLDIIVGEKLRQQEWERMSLPLLDWRLRAASDLLLKDLRIDNLDDTKLRAEIAKWLADLEQLSGPLLLSSLEKWKEDTRKRPVEDLRESLVKWQVECRQAAADGDLLREILAPPFLDHNAMLRELTADVWRHPRFYISSLGWLPAIPIVLLIMATVVLISWLHPARVATSKVRDVITRLQGHYFALALVFAVVVGLPFLVSIVSSLRVREDLAFSTLALSALSLVASALTRGEGGRIPAALKRWLFMAGAWGVVSVAGFSVIYVVIAKLVDPESYVTWLPALGWLVLVILGLALVTDINRVSLQFFYRDRLSEGFIIRPVRETLQAGQEATAGTHKPAFYRRLIGMLSALGAWPLVALAVGVLFAIRTLNETAFNIAMFLTLIILVSGILTALVSLYTTWLRKVARQDDPNATEKPEVRTNEALRLSALTADRLRGPYPLLNAAVNLAGSNDLERLGRKADFFLLSPLYCGSAATGYARTEQFDELDNLATAMAVSGAATNPQYGPTTAPAFTFLMTLCNVRLGMWVDNPRYVRPLKQPVGVIRRAMRNLRRWWPYYLVRELLGKSDEMRRYINISDGGHIENLGVYELLRRRCRLVVASDVGADPDYSFDDLANLTRMARIDLGVTIRFREEDLRKLQPGRHTKLSGRHVVMGEIEYPHVVIDDIQYPQGIGKFVYIKASLTRSDPHDLHGYKRRHPTFPHETTIDQFFSEEQFESYRELGYCCGMAAATLIGEEKLLDPNGAVVSPGTPRTSSEQQASA